MNCKKWVPSILVSVTFVVSNLMTITAQAVCILLFDGVPAPSEPPGMHPTFASCYEQTFNPETCAAATGTIRHISHPGLIPPEQEAEVTLGIWDPFNATCADHRAEYEEFVPWIRLRAQLPTDALQVTVIQGKVNLTLDTDTEEEVAMLFVYRSKETHEKGVLQIKPVCKINSKGTEVSGYTYNCTDENVLPGTYSYWPASRDYSAEDDVHYLNRSVTVTVE